MLPHEQQEQRICGNQKPCLTQHTVTSPPRTGKGQARVRPGGRSFGHIAGANHNQAPDRLSHSGKPAAQIVASMPVTHFPNRKSLLHICGVIITMSPEICRAGCFQPQRGQKFTQCAMITTNPGACKNYLRPRRLACAAKNGMA